MSRIGRQPIQVPAGVEIGLEGSRMAVEGPRGRLERELPAAMQIVRENGTITVQRPSESRAHRSLHGLTRTLVANMVTGVTQGFEKRLEIHGVGYRATQTSFGILLQVGHSHPVEFPAPEGIELRVEPGNPLRIVVSGANKETVGETAALIRRVRKPEPYKGKGIRYANEVVRRKAGKAGSKKK
ncbi:MAG: 50S ribosomal protein L6 [Chloroflexi bacterium]|nr:50S ribosomal protein L6 [Chloroflexota bacterium]